MARYKWIDTSPRFLAVDLAKQLLPGSFEHAVHHLFEHEIDLGSFAVRYRNDQTSKAKSGTRADSQRQARTAVCRRLELPGAMLCLAALSTVRSGRYLCSMN